MKKQTSYLFLVMAILFIIVGSLISSAVSFVPFSREFVNGYSKYEGMQNPSDLSETYDKSPKLDLFGDAKATPNCTGSGYTSDTGFICFSPQQIQLLRTRGGNAST